MLQVDLGFKVPLIIEQAHSAAANVGLGLNLEYRLQMYDVAILIEHPIGLLWFGFFKLCSIQTEARIERK